ncbi:MULTISPECIES: hypothetical protein [unclassified Rhizobium]|uniref:hypothetical protein n=1 Tax=unclassified Rhizobium TaxID=2613769 RepID=UPI00117A1835|nr:MULTISPECIES: hypothetical protein [unclassified Rhizobium]MDH7805473.1 hypothetical protein [Rhizobium sp. AN67]MDQ4406991.1 hypothetical protein [Rhizobium sp. AN63]
MKKKPSCLSGHDAKTAIGSSACTQGQSGLHARRKITGESINCADWEHVPDMAAAMPRPWSPRNLNHLLTLTKSVGMKFATPQVTDVRMDMMSQKRTWRTML